MTDDDTSPVDVRVQTRYGEKSFAGIAPGKSAVHSFAVRAGSVPAGTVDVEGTGTGHLADATFSEAVTYAAGACG